eukprot:m.214388 g.214388  ORF g.214388 m.214388 type:complete len:534 (-) comp27135_c0_seq1:103-1704(-)
MQRFKKSIKRPSAGAAQDDTDSIGSSSSGTPSRGSATLVRSKADDKIMDAIMKKDHKALRQLVEKRRFTHLHAPNQYQQYALITACQFNSPECVEILMDADSDIQNVRDVDGRSAVHMVAESGMAKVLAILLKKGADITAADPRGYAPLHLAAMEGHDVIIQLLLGYSVPIDAEDREGNTALMLACKGSHANAVNKLIHGGADLNKVNHQQRTALMFACEVGLTPSVKMLVEKGAKINVKDANGTTARELASLGGHDGCVAALPVQSYMVDVVGAALQPGDGGGPAAPGPTGQQLLADMKKEIEALKAELSQTKQTLATERAQSAKLQGEVGEMRIQLDTFKSLDGPGDDLFDDMDDLLDLEDETAESTEKIVAGMTPEGKSLVDKLRRENTAARFEVITLTEQLQNLGEVPSSTTGMAKAGELVQLRKRNHDLENQLASLSGDVVPLSIVEQLKQDAVRQVEELKAELAEVTESAVAAAEDVDYASVDALEAKVAMYRQLLIEAVRGDLADDTRAEIEHIAASAGSSPELYA